jgi:hypothetical protein
LQSAIHFAQDSAGAGKLDFDFSHWLKLFDRNSQVRFHECMVGIGLQQSLMHAVVHSLLINHN